MSRDASANYLRDLGDLLKRAALSVREQRDGASGDDDRMFEAGRLTAYYEVISLMQQQAVAFGIELHQVQLDDIEPDRDLL